VGDVWTLTVEEYREMKPGKRIFYSLFRHPVMMLFIGGPIWMVIASRISTRDQTWKQRLNVYFTNIVIAVLAVGMSLLIGWKEFLIIQGPVIYLATIAGIYLFYLQHQYDDVIWCRTEDWDYKKMALEGSSFFKLPAILQWFSGNIGYHHIHHLGPTIPNYNLARCHNENPGFQDVKPITFFKSLHSLKLRLWDEERQRIVSFREMRKMAG
jgi:omega-6 fatty acid desaturase (delta-12 desaturase)